MRVVAPPRTTSRLLRDGRSIAAFVFLAALVTAVVFGPLLYKVSPFTLDLSAAGASPSAAHWLGTDESGRDVFARLLAGGRVSLTVGITSMLLALFLGLLIGGIAGARRGFAESLLMRFTDAALAIPVLFIVITLLAMTGPSVPMLILAVGLTSWMGLARLVRGELLVLRSQPYVEAAVAMGAPSSHTVRRHLLPHLVPTLVVFSTLGVGTAILTESALSFLGLGVQPPAASWGNMLSGAQSYVFSYPWLAAYPGLLILLTVIAVNLLGEALRDALDYVSDHR